MDPGPVPLPQSWDEPTIDCQQCGAPAACELLIQNLDDRAEWRTIRRYVVCKAHTEQLELNLVELRPDERLVAMLTG